MDCYQQNLTSITFVLYSNRIDRPCFEIKIVFLLFPVFNWFDRNRIDLRSNHGLLTRDVGVRVEMWLQLDVSRSDARGYTPGVHTRRFRVVCLLESACNLDLSYNRFRVVQMYGLESLFMNASMHAEKDYSRFHDYE